MGGFHSHRSRRVWFLVVLALALFSLVSISVAAQEKITLTVATPWGDTTAFNGVFPALVEAYQKLRPDVEIEFLWGWSGEKIIAALAGGVLPDIVFGWGNTDEMREVFMPLDELMERKGVRLDDYLVGSIGQMHLLGKTWTLQVFIDPNFPLIYNKTYVRRSGSGSKSTAPYRRGVRQHVPKVDAARRLGRFGADCDARLAVERRLPSF